MAILSGVADDEKISQILSAIDGMEQDFGFPLNMSPDQAFDPHVGRMSGMLPGFLKTGESTATRQDLRF